MRALILFCVVLTFVSDYAEACTCARTHPQVQFCNANYVVKAKILQRKETGGSIFENVVYTVKVTTVYKGSRYFKGRRVQIFTASGGAACGSFFKIGSEYVITGTIRDSKWRTSSCSWNTEVSSLPPYQRDALKSEVYRKNCFCDVNICFGDKCSAPTQNACFIKQDDDISCLFRENSCKRGNYGCAWQSPACF
ncbi:metalloproteinase inhibitor 3-like [Crassostrea angulata]|uniref:metalloproteinase inhibitor 3-like n=1 Tax=Magallana gigas TaxID=29159 RepID=UPI00148ADB41|nr:metalloproteinase inhibitor 3-like [Crassostrea gigas]XP_052676608.1 metalloproteinase inhibitor 3-like [Crassostrea angulata]